jgi:hypothetical protein
MDGVTQLALPRQDRRGVLVVKFAESRMHPEPTYVVLSLQPICCGRSKVQVMHTACLYATRFFQF